MSEKQWRLFAAGDYCPRDTVGESCSTNGIVDPDLLDSIRNSDISVANLSGPVPGSGGKISKSGPYVKQPHNSIKLYQEIGFDVSCLANNHLFDFGVAGYEETLKECSNMGIKSLGAGSNRYKTFRPIVFEPIEGHTVAFHNICEREFNAAGRNQPGCAWESDPILIPSIKSSVEQYDTVVVISHGGAEYEPVPTSQRQARLRSLAEVNVDLIIGHHVHVPQGWEEYRGTPIFYSLGDFIFDHRPKNEKSDWGIALDIEFIGGDIENVEIIPTKRCYSEGYAIRKMHSTSDKLDYLHRLSQYSSDRKTLKSLWQEIAIRRWNKGYSRDLHKIYSHNLKTELKILFDPRDHSHIWENEKEKLLQIAAYN